MNVDAVHIGEKERERERELPEKARGVCVL